MLSILADILADGVPPPPPLCQPPFTPLTLGEAPPIADNGAPPSVDSIANNAAGAAHAVNTTNAANTTNTATAVNAAAGRGRGAGGVRGFSLLGSLFSEISDDLLLEVTISCAPLAHTEARRHDLPRSPPIFPDLRCSAPSRSRRSAPPRARACRCAGT